MWIHFAIDFGLSLWFQMNPSLYSSSVNMISALNRNTTSASVPWKVIHNATLTWNYYLIHHVYCPEHYTKYCEVNKINRCLLHVFCRDGNFLLFWDIHGAVEKFSALSKVLCPLFLHGGTVTLLVSSFKLDAPSSIFLSCYFLSFVLWNSCTNKTYTSLYPIKYIYDLCMSDKIYSFNRLVNMNKTQCLSIKIFKMQNIPTFFFFLLSARWNLQRSLFIFLEDL